jgi:hypothetical protein
MLAKTRWIAWSLPFFTLAYLYLWLVVEPSLIYHGFGTSVFNAVVFSAAPSFLVESVRTPGGAVSYIGGFLSQGYAVSWLGALIIVIVGASLCGLTVCHLGRAGFRLPAVLAAVPAVAVFLIISRYRQPMAACVTVGLGLSLSLGLETLSPRNRFGSIAAYCLAAAAAFWLAGGGGVLVLAMMTAAHALFVRGDRGLACMALPAAVLIVWGLASLALGWTPRQAFVLLTPWSDPLVAGMRPFLRALTFLLYAFAPLMLLLAAVRAMLATRTGRASANSSARRAGRQAAAKGRGRITSGLVRPWAAAAAPTLVLAAGLALTYSRFDKAFMQSNAYCRQRQWNKIIDLAARLPGQVSNVHFTHNLDRALFHLGRLPYAMFHFPQSPDALLLTHEDKQSSLTELELCDTFLELGEINTAERLASELLVGQGNLGVVLDRLAMIHLVKGDRETARVYLTAMKGDLVYRSRAKALLKALDQGFGPAESASLSKARSLMRMDAGCTGDVVDVRLAALLDRNPQNKMAFEYLMACYLLTGRLDKFMANMDRLGQFGYPDIPAHYEEAILLYHGMQGGRPLDTRRFPVRQEGLQRYGDFVRITGSGPPGGLQSVLASLGRDLKESYYFYFAFQCPKRARGSGEETPGRLAGKDTVTGSMK